jgi:hypothetical protein
MFQNTRFLVSSLDNASTMEAHDRILQRLLGYRVSLLIGVEFQRRPGDRCGAKVRSGLHPRVKPSGEAHEPILAATCGPINGASCGNLPDATGVQAIIASPRFASPPRAPMSNSAQSLRPGSILGADDPAIFRSSRGARPDRGKAGISARTFPNRSMQRRAAVRYTTSFRLLPPAAAG